MINTLVTLNSNYIKPLKVMLKSMFINNPNEDFSIYLIKELESEHIRAIAFNPVHKYISSLYINYRNHQKIAVIDGNIGYTGGTNLADEYANLYVKYGHWKDAAIRLEGDAVVLISIFKAFTCRMQVERIESKVYYFE